MRKAFTINDSYTKAETKLNDKKAKLFKNKDFKKWELNNEGLNVLSLIKDHFVIATHYMLPNESKLVTDKRKLLNYFSNQVRKQVKNTMEDNHEDLCQHFTEIANDFRKVSEHAVNNWSALLENINHVDFADDNESESSELIKDQERLELDSIEKQKSEEVKLENSSDYRLSQGSDLEHSEFRAEALGHELEPEEDPIEKTFDIIESVAKDLSKP